MRDQTRPIFGPNTAAASAFDRRVQADLEDLNRRGLHRQLPTITERSGVRYRLDGQPVVGFCSNDYLGLADHPSLPPSHAPSQSGAGGSRLICGDLPGHRAAETALAELAGTADAVLFPSGFQANIGVLPSLLKPDDKVFSDALNHASLIDGLRLARPVPTILPHGKPPPPDTSPNLRWWVTESIFSMDGDRACAPADDPNLCIYLDEAHALGLFPGGTGLAPTLPLRPAVILGTLSKAFGCAGAFVAASAPVCSWIRSRARSFVFTTGCSPALLPRILNAVDLVRGTTGDEARRRLWANATHFAHAFGEENPPSPIFPFLIGPNTTTVAISRDLLKRGWHVQAIRPPTVPPGTARLRLTISAAHEPEHIDAICAALHRVFAEHQLVPAITRAPTPPKS